MKQIAKGRLLLRYSRTNFNATNWHLCDYCCHFHTMTMWLTVYETQLDKFSHIFLGSLRLVFHASFKLEFSHLFQISVADNLGPMLHNFFVRSLTDFRTMLVFVPGKPF
jgi:hypothetical protein